MDLDSTRLLLDGAALRPLWSAIPALRGRRVQRAEFFALWVKPGRHFNVCYRLEFGAASEPVLASARVVAPARATEVISAAQPHRPGLPAACPHCATWLVRPTLVLQLFPFDYRLPTLPACRDAARVSQALGGAWNLTQSEPVGYRPGMRCQLRYSGPNAAVVYGKVAAEQDPGRGFRVHTEVAARLACASPRCRVSRPLAYLHELQLAVVAAAPGESLYELLRAGRAVAAEMPRAAAALADFHSLSVRSERVYTVEDEVALVDSWADLAAALFPDLVSRLALGVEKLRQTRPPAVAARAFVHRDFYDKQVLVDADGLTLLDFDTACGGDAEIDIGNFCAHLYLRGLQWDCVPRCRALADDFAAAYPLALEHDRVGWYRSATLVRLACGYALRPRWRQLAPDLLAEALA